jgi:hypothetical protein
MSDKEKGAMESQVGLTSADEGSQSASALAKPNTFTFVAILVV